jgi:hypothetical protein
MKSPGLVFVLTTCCKAFLDVLVQLTTLTKLILCNYILIKMCTCACNGEVSEAIRILPPLQKPYTHSRVRRPKVCPHTHQVPGRK